MAERRVKNVAVVYASKHGSTKEIAEAVQSALAGRGLEARLASVDDKISLSAYDAVVLGSAVYMGRWMKSASEFADSHAREIAEKPAWLFSSGPIGNPPLPMEEPFGLPELKARLRARDHRVFAGKIDKSQLGFAEKAVLMAVRAEEGDARDWDDIRSWAGAIADELTAGS
jgi:menaquinone-dependent protoporphyrinogen oxidase